MIFKVLSKSLILTVELTGDHYGEEYWQRIANRKYEPDTIGFIEDRCNPNIDFMDIGAANGAMALIAASEGARVSAYEPDARIYSVVSRNILLNPKLQPLITLHKKAISVESGSMRFRRDEDSSVLSSIVFTGHDPSTEIEIEKVSLIEEIENFHQVESRGLVLKMDIEGAEWRLIRSPEILKCLSRHKATLLLAVHPGFCRPFMAKKGSLGTITRGIWHMRNFHESLTVFSLVSKFGEIRRTNLDKVRNKIQFATLILAGYYEFIIDFD
jgi:FkbM family methyltransferase